MLRKLDLPEKILLRIGDIKNTSILDHKQRMNAKAQLVEETK